MGFGDAGFAPVPGVVGFGLVFVSVFFAVFVGGAAGPEFEMVFEAEFEPAGSAAGSAVFAGAPPAGSTLTPPPAGAIAGGVGEAAEEGSFPAEISGSFEPPERAIKTIARIMPTAMPAPAAQSAGRRERPGGTGPVRLGTPDDPEGSSNAT